MSDFCLDDKESIDFLKEAFNILSEPNRIKIFCLLWEKKAMCVCEIVSALWLKQNLVSHHLSMFKRIWLVTSNRCCTNIYYSINQDVYKKLKTLVWNIFILKDT